MRSVPAALCCAVLALACATPEPEAPAESDADAWARLYASGRRWSESNSDASVLYFERAWREARVSFPAQDPRLARSETALGEAYRRQGRIEKAQPLLESARDHARALSPAEPELLADVLESLGLLEVMQGRLAEAEAAFAEGARLRLDRLDPTSPETAESIVQIAEVQRRLGKHRIAEANLLEAASIYQEHGARYAMRIATIQNNLGLLYQETGRFDVAERQHRQAIVAARQIGGETNPNVAIYGRGLADLYVRQGKWVEAQSIYRQSLAMLRRTLGRDHIETRLTEDRLEKVDALLVTGGAP